MGVSVEDYVASRCTITDSIPLLKQGNCSMPDYRYQCLDCGTTYIGPQLDGGMTCGCVPAKSIRGTFYGVGVTHVKPLSDELLESLSVSEAGKVRSALCLEWGIPNKSHAFHGSNFSSNQTLVNLINNIVEPVRGGLLITVRQKVRQKYGYDIETQMMA